MVDNPGRTGRLLTNFSWLAGGRTMGALMALAATALAARALGASDFGLVVMIHAAALMLKQLCNVKTGDAVIRYGVPLAEEGRIGELRGLLIGFARLDLIAGLISAVLGGLVLLLLADRFGLPAYLYGPATFYLLVMGVSVVGSPRGTLRLLDKFGALSAQLAVGPALKLVLVGALLLTPYRDSVAAYVWIWGIAFLVEHVVTWWRAVRAFQKNYGGVATLSPDLDRADVRGFLFTTYWQSTLDAAPKQAATLLAGTLLGTSAAALFAFARELAEVLSKPVTLLRQVVFPDLARLWRNDLPRFIRVTWRTGAITGAIGLAVALGSLPAAGPILEGLAGADFGAAATLLTLLLLAAAIDLGGAAFRPASYVMGNARALLNVQIVSTLVYLGGFILLTHFHGLNGVGASSVLAALVTFVGAGAVVQRGYRKRLRADRQPAFQGHGSEA